MSRVALLSPHGCAARTIERMSETSRAERPRPDACPGALHVHAAADGGLARVRVPGGELSADQFRTLAEVAEQLGTGGLELTSRANVQVRGLDDGCENELAERLAAEGLLPSPTHERVRNIVASPYSGCDGGGLLDVLPLARELDARLCGTPELAGLPGRFLFTVDDGRGDVEPLRADVGLIPVGDDAVSLRLDGTDSGVLVRVRAAVHAAILAAEQFLAERALQDSSAWRLAELDSGPRRVADGVCARLAPDDVAAAPASPGADAVPAQPRFGVVGRRGERVTVAAGAPLGRLSREQVSIMTRASEAAGSRLRLTPWRTVVLPGLSEGEVEWWTSELDTHGLIVDPSSGWAGVTACTGHPGCAKALADVRGDAARALRHASSPTGGTLPVHWVGCERRCGRPRGRVVEVLATEAGYEVGLDDEVWASRIDADRVSAAMNAARRTM